MGYFQETPGAACTRSAHLNATYFPKVLISEPSYGLAFGLHKLLFGAGCPEHTAGM